MRQIAVTIQDNARQNIMFGIHMDPRVERMTKREERKNECKQKNQITFNCFLLIISYITLIVEFSFFNSKYGHTMQCYNNSMSSNKALTFAYFWSDSFSHK